MRIPSNHMRCSFDKILQKNIEENKRKHWWAFESKEGVKAIAGKDAQGKLEFWNHKPKNALMYYPEACGSKQLGSTSPSSSKIVKSNTRLPKDLSNTETDSTGKPLLCPEALHDRFRRPTRADLPAVLHGFHARL